MMKHIENSVHCCACGACKDVCRKKAISLCINSEGYINPVVDESRCIFCGACQSVCPCNAPIKTHDEIKSYIAINKNKDLYDYSSSGGVFSAIAASVISNGGVVFGSAVEYENNTVQVRHTCVDNLVDLKRIQGSKYVHSQTEGVFPLVRKLLEESRTVLFSGTSCQIAALQSYLKKNYDSLFTVDLVCHGVPEIIRLKEYISYLEKKYRCRIEDISFRRKLEPGFYANGESFIITLKCRDKISGEVRERYISKKASAYFLLFLQCVGYRQNCYSCRYASVNKPADITLGDFRPNRDETEFFLLSKDKMYSSVLVHTVKGHDLLESISGIKICGELDLEAMLMHHPRLQTPSKATKYGLRLFSLYRVAGFRGLQMYIDAENAVMRLPRKIKKSLKIHNSK
ncbi:MAG: Coenzyme F420 hydrogenase/dehydrogenase, beta subunit C-terminal domain [Eubacterium sp.]|nr:Coenzyme F420 hydrogenase/dehydrogenase, beta subunit C-terminal domain [Eubacterium sp.]